MKLHELFPNLYSEDKQIEFKARLNREDILGWLKTVGGFANANGGVFLLGVEDKTLTLIGYSSEEMDKEKLFFYHTVSEHMANPPFIETKPLSYDINGHKRFLLRIDVKEASNKPCIIRYQGMPMIFVRRDGFTNAASVEEIQSLSLNGKFPSFDQQETNLVFDEKNFTELAEFYAERNQGKKLPKKQLSAIGFFSEQEKLKKGAWLFADDYSGDETKMVCTFFQGKNRGSDRVLDSKEFSGNLLASYRFAMEFIHAKMNHGFQKLPEGREEVDSYPKRAVFEALINALAHRDYFLTGSQTSIEIFQDRLSITSPGCLYHQGEVQRTTKLDSFLSRRRNELISNVFVLCKAMEAKGTGFEKMEEDYRKADERHKPFLYSKNNQFTLVLPDLTYEPGVEMNEDSLEVEGSIVNGSAHDLAILSFCFKRERSIKEIAEKLGVANSTFLRNKILKTLTDQGYLLPLKKGRTLCYITNFEKVSLK